MRPSGPHGCFWTARRTGSSRANATPRQRWSETVASFWRGYSHRRANRGWSDAGLNGKRKPVYKSSEASHRHFLTQCGEKHPPVAPGLRRSASFCGSEKGKNGNCSRLRRRRLAHPNLFNELVRCLENDMSIDPSGTWRGTPFVVNRSYRVIALSKWWDCGPQWCHGSPGMGLVLRYIGANYSHYDGASAYRFTSKYSKEFWWYLHNDEPLEKWKSVFSLVET